MLEGGRRLKLFTGKNYNILGRRGRRGSRTRAVRVVIIMDGTNANGEGRKDVEELN